MLENTTQPLAGSAMHELMTMKRSLTPWFSLLLLLVGCDYKVPKEATASGEEMFQLCLECHGETGAGHREYNAPAIAGLPAWYIEAQLGKFQSGARGAHPADLGGLMMRPMTRSFHNQADLKEVAKYVASMPRPASVPVIEGGNAEHGKQLFTVCSACHQPDGSGQQLVKAPPLKSASDWYLLTTLKKFKDGVRGTSPKDIEGTQMRPQAQALADEQAMKDVVAYIATLK